MNMDKAVRLQGKGLFFEPIDIHFARFIEDLSGSGKEVLLACALVSRYTREGHICIDLADFSGTSIVHDEKDLPQRCPDLARWTSCLKRSPVVGMPGEGTPLVLDRDGRLYLRRYWDYEQRLADKLLDSTGRRFPVNRDLLKRGLNRMFLPGGGGDSDWQKIAAITAVFSGLTVVTGGPGTGKTFVVSRILALLMEQSGPLRVALTAPTGKAAQRLQESVLSSAQGLACSDDIRRFLPREASTIHRLLGMVPGSSRSRYWREHPLPVDVVVVDEASMVALPLMSRLVQALGKNARLILLGDKNQLASVEAGYVLGDICDLDRHHAYSPSFRSLMEHFGCEVEAGSGAPGLQDSIIELKKTFRFTPESGIYQLSSAVNEGDSSRCMEILGSGTYPDLSFVEYGTGEDLIDSLRERIVEGYRKYLEASSIQEKFMLFDSFRVLCPLRAGPFGIQGLNSTIEQILLEHGLISKHGTQYHGRPILITANDYGLRLFNGDIGIILADDEEGELGAFFQVAGGRARKVSPVRLPAHETSFAMTVHKSQGSEYDAVVLILPSRDSPVMTRELVYTGITRAKKHLQVWARPEIFSAGISRRIERSSGLNNRLWGKT